ncbi:MAG TPA: uracil-DNA glycosylase family protein [Candidatus Coprenecus pullistercoris]|nr:uracil-DNA glycosylase family protein [Candidatus Coprenecus pullistercoris]
MRREFPLFEVHPLRPFVPDNARVLLLGSFPPPHARWSMEFFYPNFQNDMWRIMGQLFYGDKEHFVVQGQKRFDYEKVVDFCRRVGIALYDAAYMVKRLRGNASDNFLKIIEPTDIQSLLSSIPSCGAVVSTGGKSAEQIAGILGVPVPAVGGSVPFTVPAKTAGVLRFYRMPSSSRAYPMPLDRKAAAYASVLL